MSIYRITGKMGKATGGTESQWGLGWCCSHKIGSPAPALLGPAPAGTRALCSHRSPHGPCASVSVTALTDRPSGLQVLAVRQSAGQLQLPSLLSSGKHSRRRRGGWMWNRPVLTQRCGRGLKPRLCHLDQDMVFMGNHCLPGPAYIPRSGQLGTRQLVKTIQR